MNKINVQLDKSFPAEFADELNEITDARVLVKQDLSDKSHILISGRPTEEQLTANKNLHSLIIPWAGLPVKTAELMKNYQNISVHNIHHNAIPVSELAFSMMMSLAKRIPQIDKNFRKNNWTDRYEDTEISILSAKHVVLLGYGEIGKLIHKYCTAFDMKIDIIRRQVKNNSQHFYSLESIEDLLPKADVLFICLPLTAETKGLLDSKRLALLPDKTILINIARGSIVDEAALFDALTEKRIYAGLDSWYQYPEDKNNINNIPPSEFSFHELENVIMTPHLGGHSRQTEQLRLEHLALLLNDAAVDETMRNRIDLKRGY